MGEVIDFALHLAEKQREEILDLLDEKMDDPPPAPGPLNVIDPDDTDEKPCA